MVFKAHTDKLHFIHNHLSNEINENIKKLPIILTLQATFLYFWVNSSSDKLTGNNDFFALISLNWPETRPDIFFSFSICTLFAWAFAYVLSKHCNTIEKMRKKLCQTEQRMKCETTSLQLSFLKQHKYRTRYEHLMEGCSIFMIIYPGLPAAYQLLCNIWTL